MRTDEFALTARRWSHCESAPVFRPLAFFELAWTARSANNALILRFDGQVDERSCECGSDLDGSVTYSASDDAETYSVVDEVARRALCTGARVMGARKEELPDHAPLAAILRYEFH